MTVVALVAAKGSPGVSTSAAALVAAWPSASGRDVVLVDADVSGGGPLTAYQRYGLGDGRGLLGWVATSGRSPLEDQLFALDPDGRRWLLPGIPDPTSAAVLGRRWVEVAGALDAMADGRDLDVVVDLGRLGMRHEATPLLARADEVLLVARSSFESISVTQPVAALLAPDVRTTSVLLVGDRDPYSRREVAAAVGLDHVAVLPHDVRAASRLVQAGGVAATRSALRRAAHPVVENLLQRLREAADVQR